ncbi:RNA polymerase sigma factor [Paenibacillus sp. PsM32]|uniref:RNA polymerase sigma factor n=1 Tax=unclassified Paenibacillus TaxID=185978 RepID=UPI002366700F|nr:MULTISPECIES: RNA polymerase sigma factor [unclassified Paenibacillus]MDN4619486.1 RNA polymerase sigma factor [Paenibacillus sp. PsM32]MDQ1236971.1 RNA polymerase sigma factor (sigma-70 family) [Paenibacillus sp. SORGH_AS_0306]MDR6109332.1 RNA polymerase sigma factor (sigma-70 family) [Paenibacillus sp. SORGH_AS_0338]WDF50540.1 RNA polymerase sigma factor [Paenibacillus sp. KACC 21273]
MEDNEIVELFMTRNESAITESSRQYGRYCYTISYNILSDSEDAEECVNDTWLRTWNAIPPQRPNKLSFFVGRITRNLSLDKFKAKKAQKRGGEMTIILGELDDCIPSEHDVEQAILEKDLSQTINRFLHTLPERECNLFLARYWYSQSQAEIAEQFAMKENNVKASLFRTRTKLKAYLMEEGIYL